MGTIIITLLQRRNGGKAMWRVIEPSRHQLSDIGFTLTAPHTCAEPAAAVPVWQVSFHSVCSAYIICPTEPSWQTQVERHQERQDGLHPGTADLKLYPGGKWKSMAPKSASCSLLCLQRLDLMQMISVLLLILKTYILMNVNHSPLFLIWLQAKMYAFICY